jgi:site-specific DNA recombinase
LKLREEQLRILSKVNWHQNANKSYFDEGIKILELAAKAYSYIRSRKHTKRGDFFNYILASYQIIDKTLYPTYRKSFDLIAEGNKTQKWGG